MILKLYCCLIFIIIVFDINTAHASAWLLEQGRYRYIIGGNKTNRISKNEKKQREETVLHVNNRIIYLRQYLEEVKNQPNLQAKILRQIKKLEQKILELLSYQDVQLANICIEYSITDNQNIGMSFLYKKDKFINKKNTSLEAAIYYKFKLFGDHDFVISAQPKILMVSNKKQKESFLGEISLLGTVKLSKLVSQSTIFLDFRQQEVFE